MGNQSAECGEWEILTSPTSQRIGVKSFAPGNDSTNKLFTPLCSSSVNGSQQFTEHGPWPYMESQCTRMVWKSDGCWTRTHGNDA